VKKIRKIGPRLPKFYYLALRGPVIMTHRVYARRLDIAITLP